MNRITQLLTIVLGTIIIGFTANAQLTVTGGDLIVPNNNVGIGTDSGITEKLTVMGNILLRDDGGSKHTLIRVQGSNTNIQSERATTSKLRLETPAGGGLTVWGQGGGQGSNVGIGTDDPTAKLEVTGQVKITGGGPGDGKVLTSDADGLASWQDAGGGGGAWEESGSTVYRSSGHVGIGTDSPNSSLTVRDGDIRVSGSTLTKRYLRFSGDLGNVSGEDGGGGAINYNFEEQEYGNGRLVFSTGAAGTTPRMRILTGGNVGIGANPMLPSSLFTVKGGNMNLQSTGAAKSARKYMLFTGGPEAGFIAYDFTGGEGLIFGRINNAGDVANENEQFRIDGGGNVVVSGTQVHASDKRLKEDIRNVSSALDRVSQLNGVTWAWKDKNKSAERQMGVVAQDVEAVAPELIMEHKGYKSVNYNGLNALTIEAIKELRAQNEALKAEVEQLKKSLN